MRRSISTSIATRPRCAISVLRLRRLSLSETLYLANRRESGDARGR